MWKLVLAATTALLIAVPSVADAQQRPQGQSRQQQSQQNARGWGDFQGALRAIAGSRLDRAHSERERPQDDDRKKRRR